VSLIFRRSKSIGPLRLTLSKRGLSLSARVSPFRVGLSASGQRTASVRLFKGWSWRNK